MRSRKDLARNLKSWTSLSSRPIRVAGFALSLLVRLAPAESFRWISRKVKFLGTLSGMANHIDTKKIFEYKASATDNLFEQCEQIEDQKFVEEVIVGSGPTGGLVASFNRDLGLPTLVIEAGFYADKSIEPHTPNDMMSHFADAGLQAILGFPPIPYAQGEVVGGGGVLNSGLYHRIPGFHKEKIEKETSLSASELAREELFVEQLLNIEQQDDATLGIYVNSPIRTIASQLEWEGEVIPRWRTYRSSSQFNHHTTLQNFDSSKIRQGHTVERLEMDQHNRGLDFLVIKGPNCSHRLRARSVALCAGPVGTARLLHRSGLASAGQFSFYYHHMQRTISKWPFEVNDLKDIDPFQSWSRDGKLKIGAAVSTEQMLLLPNEKRMEQEDLRRWAAHYISIGSSGKGGMIPALGTLWPYFLSDKNMRKLSKQAIGILLEQLYAAGALHVEKLAPSTVHIFGSVPMGKTSVIDSQGFVSGTNQSVRIRDSSLIPFPLNVNPQGPALAMVSALERRRSK